jgi:hypothetical protein
MSQTMDESESVLLGIRIRSSSNSDAKVLLTHIYYA